MRFMMRWTSTGCRVYSFGFTSVISWLAATIMANNTSYWMMHLWLNLTLFDLTKYKSCVCVLCVCVCVCVRVHMNIWYAHVSLQQKVTMTQFTLTVQSIVKPTFVLNCIKILEIDNRNVGDMGRHRICISKLKIQVTNLFSNHDHIYVNIIIYHRITHGHCQSIGIMNVYSNIRG